MLFTTLSFKFILYLCLVCYSNLYMNEHLSDKNCVLNDSQLFFMTHFTYYYLTKKNFEYYFMSEI